MTDDEKKYITTENICINCGKKFILRKCEYESFSQRGWNYPKKCYSCRKAIRKEKEEVQKAIDAAKWKKEKIENQREFEKQLKQWNLKKYMDILPEVENTLYILGNGFDMMHGVNSSYYSFRDSLGKKNTLRLNLEHFITVEDLWADFEESLAHLNMQFISSQMNADNWLDIMGAYELDAGMAEFYMAADGATQIISDIVVNLQRRFYDWVSKLKIGTDDRPLRALFCNGKVLNFNYTEFVEPLYGIPKEDICYIHGCRQKKKAVSREKLILGHTPRTSDSVFGEWEQKCIDICNPKKREMIHALQDMISRQLAEYDEELTKNCENIIKRHKNFFESLKSTKMIITVGHSFSKVDWPYFSEIISNLPTGNQIQWYFGCYGLHDLKNLDCMLKEFQIEHNSVSIFRTDVINVEKNTILDGIHEKNYDQKVKVIGKSDDGRWNVQKFENMLQIIERDSGSMNYSVEVPSHVASVCFSSDNNILFVICRTYPSGILLFRLENEKWNFTGELDAKADYNFLTKSLNRILLCKNKIKFVYNNRIRVHSLWDGSMIYTRKYKGARHGKFSGEDITNKFLKI